MYTEETLREACRRIAATQLHTNESLYAALVDSFSLVAVVPHISVVCFIFKIENDDAEIVREAMIDLATKRKFAFEAGEKRPIRLTMD